MFNDSDTSPARNLKRKRTEDEQNGVATQLRKHADRLWIDDGNVVLVANDSMGFRLHRSTLSHHSDVFKSLFAFPSSAEDNEIIEDCPVVRLHDSGEDLATFFTLLYDGGTVGFFKRGEEIGFATVRAMLLLSFKYEVQHIREEALRRLRIWYPSTLTGWNALRQLESQEKFVRPDLKDSITIINIARKLDLPEFLPFAFYRCTCMQLAEIRKPVHYGSSIEMLSQGDIVKALSGVDRIESLVNVRIGILCDHVAVANCLSRKACKQVVLDLVKELNPSGIIFARRWFLYPLEPQIDAALKKFRAAKKEPYLCSFCEASIRKRDRAHQEEAWTFLGRLYHLSP